MGNVQPNIGIALLFESRRFYRLRKVKCVFSVMMLNRAMSGLVM